MDQDLDSCKLLAELGHVSRLETSDGPSSGLAREGPCCRELTGRCCRRAVESDSRAPSPTGFPIARAVFRPRVLVGKKRTRRRRANAQSRTARRSSSCRRSLRAGHAKRLEISRGLMYVTGVKSLVSITSPRSAQAASTASRSAMSAMLQPAAMSGKPAVTSGRERIGRFPP